MGKPTVKEIEEYMAALNLPEERFNGTVKEDIPVKQKMEQFFKDKNVFLEREETYNVVSKPKHYMLFDEIEIKERAFEGQGIEVRDVIEKLVRKVQSQNLQTVPHYTKEASLFESDYVQLMQYLMRFMDKNGKEDLEKACWYLDKMTQAY